MGPLFHLALFVPQRHAATSMLTFTDGTFVRIQLEPRTRINETSMMYAYIPYKNTAVLYSKLGFTASCLQLYLRLYL